jgi:hypothetical protein
MAAMELEKPILRLPAAVTFFLRSGTLGGPFLSQDTTRRVPSMKWLELTHSCLVLTWKKGEIASGE